MDHHFAPSDWIHPPTSVALDSGPSITQAEAWTGAGSPSRSLTGGESASPCANNQPSSDPGTVKVLVVDDQPDVLATTAELFKIMGYEVVCASNGQEALGILKSTPDIQVLFSDVVMPGMNGVRLAREARRLLPGIHVILASGFQASAMDPQGADLREFHFLAKPFRIADIARMLRK